MTDKHIDLRTGKPKIILDLCGGTGSWSKPYRDASYDVRLVTLPDQDVRTYEPPENVYGILAAPPCTEFSIAKTTAPRDFAKGMETVNAVLSVVWRCQERTKLEFWALENPRGLLVRFLGRPAFEFEQWQFGNGIEKPTCLWGHFTAPAPTVRTRPEIAKFRNKKTNQNQNSREYASPKCPPEHADYISQFATYQERRAAIRAITPPGFAQAFFRANR